MFKDINAKRTVKQELINLWQKRLTSVHVA